jgi:hypothetical protein
VSAGGAPDPPAEARSTIRRLERLWRGWFPLTVRGVLLAAGSFGALWLYAYGQFDLVVFALGAGGLVLSALAATITLATVLWLRRSLRAHPERAFRIGRFLEAGERLETGFVLPPSGWLRLATLRWSWRVPASFECGVHEDEEEGLVEELRPLRRCEAWQLTRTFVVGDPLGLSRIAFDDPSPCGVRVLPNVGRLREVPLLPALAAADGYAHPAGAPEGDRMEIRPYVPGDSTRDILWKTYARTGHLNVRRPERSVSRLRRSVAYLVASEGDEAAAAAARVTLESDSLGRQWRFGADGSPDASGDLGAALTAVARSGSLASGGEGEGFAGFIDRAARQGDTHCIVFVPGRPGAWVQRVLAAANRGIAFSFIVAVDRLLPPFAPAQPRVRRLFWSEPPPQGTPRDQIEDLLRTLASTGAAVQVVERQTGGTPLRERAQATAPSHPHTGSLRAVAG